MSTIQDLENAPVGATTSSAETNARYVKSPDRWLLFDGRGDSWVDEYGLESEGFTLDPPSPTTAQEALDLAWNLAHPVKEGQHIPEGTRLLDRSDRNDLSAYTTQANITINARESLTIRTLDPLPDPEPDWLDAPALPTREQIAMAIYRVLKPQYGDFGVPDDAADAVLDLLKGQDR